MGLCSMTIFCAHILGACQYMMFGHATLSVFDQWQDTYIQEVPGLKLYQEISVCVCLFFLTPQVNFWDSALECC
jgi:hypothetical protein